ncbi:MAG: hypothetical protein PHC30_09645 [Lentisphaeria bacterium]|nr:hypothetical protein [Lentisphaeria bacterium]
MTEARKKLPDGLSFADLDDRQTLSSFDALLGSLPDLHITRLLAWAEAGLNTEEKRFADDSVVVEPGALASLSALEKKLSESLRVWRGDERFALALVRHGEVLTRLAGRAAELRSKVWRRQLRQLAERQEYWEASEQYKSWRVYLREQSQQDLELYSTMAAPVGANGGGLSYLRHFEQVLEDEYLAILPKAFVEYQALAERALNITNKYGVAVALCLMLQQMSAPGGELVLPEPLLEARRKADRLLARARELVEEKNLLRTVAIEDMSSATPGVGMTYSRDLENELRSVLTSFGLWRLVRVADPGTTRSPWGYVVHSGVVANFDGSESAERQAMRTVRRHGETRRRPNPNYRQEEGNVPLPKEQSSPLIYSQDILEQVIHVKEIERLAHVRVFMHMRGPGVSTLIEVNEFYTRKFVLEESHPFNDVRVSEVKTVYDATQLQAADAEPTLRYDRVWTPGEMLDWARRDSLRMVALQLLNYINQYPLYLAQRAERLALDGDVAESAEQWGNCMTLCMNLDTESDLVTLMKTSTPPAASSYESCLASLSQQRQALSELKRTVGAKMVQQMNDYLRRQRQAAASAAAAPSAPAN